MIATIIDGRAVAARVRAEVARAVEDLVSESGRRPGLATILVGDDPASEIYVRGKRRSSEEVGIADHHRHLPATASQADVAELIEACNGDPEVSGILLQLPVPEGLDGSSLTAQILPEKDVDGLTPVSAGRVLQNLTGLRPCTPLGVLELLDTYGVSLEGAHAVVVGRSNLVGRPLGPMLMHRNATVTMCHSRTADLAAECARADVLVAAAGVPRLLGAAYVKPGAAVIDVGINRTEEGLVGDVDFGPVSDRAGLITPVPGGVGPMTLAMLLQNTVAAARAQFDREREH
ncbi:MAG: bifunctional methylenetetrahydrofolate dehydrogenase/methenyltetrahydrofolate cyclohydrolase FolD [Solirubrobacterales bacterium]|nr:bifunctional methylenetetrahydrofolate dehydrogenase/methenyltetrahydrofolate cyclohydrolase FolD [Solirubrobacterales bacterium]MBV9166134.1 bifunctional methylenetetrahydrofolate dehydrogenase/methenyltetrahydrofolate cyclohydrolase FolD [Solirubrobacterales bacterium]MBV9536585.1 bifunctional methylenetetrahydrofolate dehydrogenase/methenyltetrahydrofolate cyclohydrolase FolD [Solirubrobacterales bacterium]